MDKLFKATEFHSGSETILCLAKRAGGCSVATMNANGTTGAN